MAPRKKGEAVPVPKSPIKIGNCEVTVEAKSFSSNSESQSLQISVTKPAKIRISVRTDVSGASCNGTCTDKKVEGGQTSGFETYQFVLVNSKDSDSQNNNFLQEALELYAKELPAMNYAANTGKQSKFLERSIFNGRYSTLLLKCISTEGSSLPGEVIAAITYQIVPTDTKYAEIPLAAVKSVHQDKGFGSFLYIELRKRLQNVGIHTIYCWGDKESEGFWIKKGFTSIAQVSRKGKTRRLPIKAGMRKALCYPGGSTLMVCHLNKETSADLSDATKLWFSLKTNHKVFSGDDPSGEPALIGGNYDFWKSQNKVNCRIEDSHCKDLMTDEFPCKSKAGCPQGHDSGEHTSFGRGDYSKTISTEDRGNEISVGTQGTKRRAWEASLSSLKSKKVKGTHQIPSDSDSVYSLDSQSDRLGTFFNACSLNVSKSFCFKEASPTDSSSNKHVEDTTVEGRLVSVASEARLNKEIGKTGKGFKIMLMNIADDAKKSQLTEVIGKLGGSVNPEGILSTHVVTGKVRTTLNFCTALCLGSWVVSSCWLKESFRKGRFVEELPHVLHDDEYVNKYRIELKDAILRAKAKPGSLLKGYNICIAAHVQPPVKTLSAIVRSAGANVINGLDEVDEESKTIFIACEEDMEDALIAAKKGIWTFSSDWLMNCIMRQELNLEAQQFAESL